MNNHYVKIIKFPDEIVKTMGPFSERKADKVEDGVSINLNFEEYYTIVFQEDDADSVTNLTRTDK